MITVLTYGTFDLLHYGHIRLLERAKKLGDFLIVGITADDFDKKRGKINVKQTLMERIEAVKATGLADKIIVEEYEGQKIDDIKRYGVDIFTLGSDWVGKYDYLNEYCRVIYLDRTEGVSSSKLRSEIKPIKMGVIGNYAPFINKVKNEDKYVNGLDIVGICTNNIENMSDEIKRLSFITNNYNELLDNVDAVYIKNNPKDNYEIIKDAIKKGKHILCELPITDNVRKTEELYRLASENEICLMPATRTAYSTAYERLLLLLKGGIIGNIVSVDTACTSMVNLKKKESLNDWGPTALLPIFQILGTEYVSKRIITNFEDNEKKHDIFTKIEFIYPNAVASMKVAESAKTEGEMIIMGTLGYVYVPAPWWKTEYFELRFEDSSKNKRYFYQLEGEGIRYELVTFSKWIESKKDLSYIDKQVSIQISKIFEDFNLRKDVTEINI